MTAKTAAPTFRTRLLGGALIASLAVAPALGQERGVTALLDQANYWKLQNRPDQVVRTLERVLQVDPQNADALSGLAEAQAQLGNAAQAQEALGRLRQSAPADPRTAQADVAVRTSTVDAQALAQARQLAQAGRAAEAVERYRQIFGNSPIPDSFALEFYQVLAGTESGWREARDGLQRLARRVPNNTAVQLAYGQVLTYREETRAEGIEILRRLSGRPDSQQSATAAWRQALTWLGRSPEAVPPLEGYLRQNPNDAEMLRRLEEARTRRKARWTNSAKAARMPGSPSRTTTCAGGGGVPAGSSGVAQRCRCARWPRADPAATRAAGRCAAPAATGDRRRSVQARCLGTGAARCVADRRAGAGPGQFPGHHSERSRGDARRWWRRRGGA